jgi:plastocyanin
MVSFTRLRLKGFLHPLLPVVVLGCAILPDASTSFAALRAEGSATGRDGRLHLAVSAIGLAYNKKKLASGPGKVTIRLTNPGPTQHSVAIESRGGKQIAASKVIAEGKTSVTAGLRRGTYRFFCIVPGHRQAGMAGTLKVH